MIVRRDHKQSDMSMNRKDGSAKDNMIFDDKIGFDPYNPANTNRRNNGTTDETSDKKDESIDDNMLSDSQDHEKESGDSESGTLCVSDDPRRGARLKDTERIETESGPSDTSPTEKASSDNVSNDHHTLADTSCKDNGQPDSSLNRK